jgi:lysine-N-methylase
MWESLFDPIFGGIPMQIRVPAYFDRFRCLAGACPDTCCGQWGIIIEPAVKDRYLALEGELGDRLRAALDTLDGEDCLRLENGRCPMLTEDNLCALISAHGTELLSTTCDSHPRFSEIYGGLEETMLSLSCPAAAELLLEQQEPLAFLTRSDDRLPEPTDLDAELFFTLQNCRETAFAIVQDRSFSLSDRLALLLCFADRIDRRIGDLSLCRCLSQCYTDPRYRRRQLRRIRRLRSCGTMTDARQLLLAMEHLTEAFPRVLTELETTPLEKNAVQLEQLTVYFLFRWWMKAACDGYLWRQAAAAVVSVLAIASMAKTMGDIKEAARLYSKEVEHAEENLSLLRRAMELPYFSRDQLLHILEVDHAI